MSETTILRVSPTAKHGCGSMTAGLRCLASVSYPNPEQSKCNLQVDPTLPSQLAQTRHTAGTLATVGIGGQAATRWWAVGWPAGQNQPAPTRAHPNQHAPAPTRLPHHRIAEYGEDYRFVGCTSAQTGVACARHDWFAIAAETNRGARGSPAAVRAGGANPHRVVHRRQRTGPATAHRMPWGVPRQGWQALGRSGSLQSRVAAA